MDLQHKYPSINYLEQRARRRTPHFAWEYLASGTGAETLIDRNIARLNEIEFSPSMCKGDFTPKIATELFGHAYSAPFGAAPVGMSGLMWPGAERYLAATAARHNMPYCLSMVACETPETIGPLAAGNGWFQLYAPSQMEIENDLLRRAKESGFKTLVFTVDVPVGSRRERQLRAGLTMPPKLTPLTLMRIASRPAWTIATLKHGQPRFRILEHYFKDAPISAGARLVGEVLDARPDWDHVRRTRDNWDGNFIVKGIMTPEDARASISAGADAIVVSNHGGRQFDAAPATIDVLPDIAREVDSVVPVIFDSGLRGGLDIMRALSRGADFCLFGRAFLFAVAALGERGADHAYEILKADLENNMIQLGIKSLDELRRK